MVASFLNRSGGFSKSSIDLVPHVLEGERSGRGVPTATVGFTRWLGDHNPVRYCRVTSCDGCFPPLWGLMPAHQFISALSNIKRTVTNNPPTYNYRTLPGIYPTNLYLLPVLSPCFTPSGKKFKAAIGIYSIHQTFRSTSSSIYWKPVSPSVLLSLCHRS